MQLDLPCTKEKEAISLRIGLCMVVFCIGVAVEKSLSKIAEALNLCIDIKM